MIAPINFTQEYQDKIDQGTLKDQIAEYCLKVLDGRIRACKKIKKSCRRHIYDFNRQGDESFPYYFDLQAAYRPIRFAGKLKHWEGDFSGKFFEPELWQTFILGVIFGWKKKSNHKRRFRYAYVEVPRKNGKSFLASVIALYMLVADGEEGAQVYSLATKRDQAKIVWGSAGKIAVKSRIPGITEHWLQLQFKQTNSRFEPLASDSDKLDGLNPHCAICDELHEWDSRDLWDVIEDAFGARSQPLMFAITTAGHNRNGICFEQRTHGVDILDGFEDGSYNDDTYFVFIADMDPSWKTVETPKGPQKVMYYEWKNQERWYEANPCLGAAKGLDYMIDQCNKATLMVGKENAFLNKQLDIWTEAAVKWLDMEKWDVCGYEIERKKLYRAKCWVGLDLSSNTDLTAAVYVFAPGPYSEWTILPIFFLPEENLRGRSNQDRVQYEKWVKEGYIITTPGNMVDIDFVYQYILDTRKEFQIAEIGFDPWKAIEVATKLQKENFEVVEMRQGHGTMGPPTREFELKMLRQELRHGGHPILRWMAGNTVVIKDHNENIKPDKEKSPQRIDGIVATIMGLGRALYGEGVQGPSIYETRGPRVF